MAETSSQNPFSTWENKQQNKKSSMKRKLIPKTIGLLAAVGLLAGASMSTYATLELTTTGPDGPGGNPNNAYWLDMAGNPTDAEIVAALNSITLGLNLTTDTLTPVLLKNDQANPPAANSGALGSAYVVTYFTPAAPESVTITHVAGQPFFDTTKLTWLLAKDGVHGHWLWNLTGIWDGKQTIEINNLWPGEGDFSHIEIGGVAVPEPTTMIAGALLLLPFAASTIRFMRKNRKA